jgi:non-heme chloroperoxidase
MKELRSGVATIVLLGFSGCSSSPETRSEGHADIVSGIFPEAQDAVRAALLALDDIDDEEALRSVHVAGPKFSQLDIARGRTDFDEMLAEELALVTSVRDGSIEWRDLKIDVFGDVAIVTALPHFSLTFEDGATSQLDLVSTLVWVRTAAGWKIAHENNNEVPAIVKDPFVELPIAANAAEPERHEFTTSDGATISYLEAGQGPLIVIVPGWTLPATSWRAQLDHFADRYHVVAMDPRAHGASSKPMDGMHVARLAADLGELIDHLDAGPAIIAGHSHGAYQAMTYLVQSGTDKAAALIIVDMSLGTDVPVEEAHPIRNGWRPWIAGLQGPDRREWTRQWTAGMLRDDYPVEDHEKLVDGIMQIPTVHAVTILSNSMLHDRRDYGPVLASLDIPVFFIGSDRGWAVSAAETIKALRPDAGTVNLDGTNHLLYIDHPERFNAALEALLKE